MEDIVITPTEREIMNKINIFTGRIDEAYFERYKEKNLTIRDYIFTNGFYIYVFFLIYKGSKFYNNTTSEEENINVKIFEYLEEIMFEMYLIFEFEIFDENKLYSENPKTEYERLYNLNKTQNLIIKTRTVWEKFINFMYLAIEREELEDKITGKKSKKKIFKEWCIKNNYNFMLEPLEMIEKFDNKFRTAEIHKHSKLKSYFSKGVNNSINYYCLFLLFKLSNETIINIFALFCDKEGIYKYWQKLPFNASENIEEFEKMPKWLIDYIEKNKLDKNLETFTGWLEGKE